jgi:AIG2-like family
MSGFGSRFAVRDHKVLDRGEGEGYRRTRLSVRTADAVSVRAWVYIARRPSTDAAIRRYTGYKRFLIEGGREYALPPEYIVALEGIDAVEHQNADRERDKRALN